LAELKRRWAIYNRAAGGSDWVVLGWVRGLEGFGSGGVRGPCSSDAIRIIGMSV